MRSHVFLLAASSIGWLACSESNLSSIEKLNEGESDEDSTDSTTNDDSSDDDSDDNEMESDDCDGDSRPSVIDYSPQSAAVLLPGDITLEAWAEDDNTAPTDLIFTWVGPEGTLVEENGNADGQHSFLWTGEREPGNFQLSLSVTDECENTRTIPIPLCQEGGYVQSELDLENWQLEGAAEIQNDGSLELTGLDQFSIGSAFMIDQVVMADEVSIRFEFLTEGGTGADGISLTALNVDEMTSFLGGAGCGIGYGGGIECTEGPALPGWSIEFDTWFNAELPDPTETDHTAFTFNGAIHAPEVWSEVHELEDTGWHTIEINVMAPRVTVSIDSILYIDQDISGDFNFPAYIGFTGATGGQTNIHRIRGFTVTEHVCGI